MASALLSALVFAVVAAFGDARAVAASIRDLPASTLALMALLTLVGYVVRALRWRYLTRVVGYRSTVADATYIQFSGMTMTVTPGKVGEVIKGLLARDLIGMPAARGATLVFSERLADLIGVTVLSLGAVSAVSDTVPALVAMGVALAGGVALLSSHRFHATALRVALKQRSLAPYAEHADAVSETIRLTLSPVPLATSAAFAAFAWSFEGIAFHLCLRELGFDGLSAASAIGIYAIAAIVGALSFTPGGIGLTEASLAGLLVAVGMPAASASAATLVIRVITMWFGVALGWLVIATRPGTVRRLLGADTGEPPGTGTAA